jgi:hypothetical protein
MLKPDLEVIYIKGLGSDGLLAILDNGRRILLLRPGLAPKVVEAIQAEASQVAKVDSMEFSGKFWLNGKWANTNAEFTATINEILKTLEVAIVMTDPPR